MEVKNKLVIEYIDRIRDEFLKRGHLISDDTYKKIVSKYINCNKSIEEIKKEIDILVSNKISSLIREQEQARLKKVKIEDYNNEELTLKSIDGNGYPHIISADIEVVNKVSDSHNAPVNVNFGYKNGFYKNSANTSSTTLDKLEYVICQIGKLFDVKMAETYKVYKDNSYLGIISENVCNDNETLYTYSQVTRFIDRNDPDIIALAQELERIGKTKHTVVAKSNENSYKIPVVRNEMDVQIVINSFLSALKSLKIPEDSARVIRQDYFNMIMLDYVTNNVDRNKNNYGVILSGYGDVSFAPLFDNSTIHIPSIPEGYQQINGYLIPKSNLLNCLFNHYYDDIKVFSQKCSNSEEEVISSVSNLCSHELDFSEQQWFMSKFVPNIKVVAEKEQSRQIADDQQQKVEEEPKLVKKKPTTDLNDAGKINLILMLISMSLILISITFIILFKIG